MRLLAILILLFQIIPSSGDAQVISLKGSWKFHISDKEAWASPQFDDSNWEYIVAPSAWEDEGFNGYDGFAWYRKKFDGKKLDKNGNYYLGLGFIDDSDEVYVNGKLVGFSGSMPPNFKTAYNTERKYAIPAEIINFNGENTIAIRVFDVTLGGGIIDGDLGVYQQPKNKSLLIDLQGVWSFAPSWIGDPVKKESDWKKVMVPGAWEYQGYLKYDGLAWYHRTFILPENLPAEDLVLLVGKIDDFDKTYLNGQLIGTTNDHKPFGRSQSYQLTRAYPIPAGLLKRKVSNTVEILVEDMGNIGGIFEGPIGITTRANYEKFFRR